MLKWNYIIILPTYVFYILNKNNFLGVLTMKYDFLRQHMIDLSNGERTLSWEGTKGNFIRAVKVNQTEIDSQEARLLETGFTFPKDLKEFWTEIGCGYVSPTDALDNALETPTNILDFYFNVGDWSDLKIACDFFDHDELPFFFISGLDYITIGLKEGTNLGKIYRFGQEIAPSLSDFLQCILNDATFFNQCVETVS